MAVEIERTPIDEIFEAIKAMSKKVACAQAANGRLRAENENLRRELDALRDSRKAINCAEKERDHWRSQAEAQKKRADELFSKMCNNKRKRVYILTAQNVAGNQVGDVFATMEAAAAHRSTTAHPKGWVISVRWLRGPDTEYESSHPPCAYPLSERDFCSTCGELHMKRIHGEAHFKCRCENTSFRILAWRERLAAKRDDGTNGTLPSMMKAREYFNKEEHSHHDRHDHENTGRCHGAGGEAPATKSAEAPAKEVGYEDGQVDLLASAGLAMRQLKDHGFEGILCGILRNFLVHLRAEITQVQRLWAEINSAADKRSKMNLRLDALERGR